MVQEQIIKSQSDSRTVVSSLWTIYSFNMCETLHTRAQVTLSNLKSQDLSYESTGKKLGTLSSDIFERRTSTGSEPFSLLISLDATIFLLPSVFIIIETICPKICSKTRL